MDTTIELIAQPHPSPQIRRAGFELTAPYVEQCWGPILGSSGVAVLRRLPVMWADEKPARIDTGEMGRSLGIGSPKAGGARVIRTLDRLPAWTHRAHHSLLADHIDELNAAQKPLTTTERLDRLEQPASPASPSIGLGL